MDGHGGLSMHHKGHKGGLLGLRRLLSRLLSRLLHPLVEAAEDLIDATPARREWLRVGGRGLGGCRER